MTRQYIVSGLRFTMDRQLPDLSEKGYSDLDITVAFTSAPPTTHTLQGPDGTSGSFDEKRKSLVLHDQRDDAANAWMLRQMAPIVSSVTGRLVLHASAVLLPQGLVAFIAESGTGKSTLAQAFPTPAADDLVPIRFQNTVVSPNGDVLTPLAAICFLERENKTFRVNPLTSAAALKLEVENGFGEHRDPDTWAFQFDAYHRLVEEVEHFRLTIPNDLTALPSVVDFVETTL